VNREVLYACVLAVLVCVSYWVLHWLWASCALIWFRRRLSIIEAKGASGYSRRRAFKTLIVLLGVSSMASLVATYLTVHHGGSAGRATYASAGLASGALLICLIRFVSSVHASSFLRIPGEVLFSESKIDPERSDSWNTHTKSMFYQSAKVSVFIGAALATMATSRPWQYLDHLKIVGMAAILYVFVGWCCSAVAMVRWNPRPAQLAVYLLGWIFAWPALAIYAVASR